MSATAEQITAACTEFGLEESELEIGTAIVKHIPGSSDIDVYSIDIRQMVDGLDNYYSTFGDGIKIFAFTDLENAEVTYDDPDGLLQDGLGD